MQVTCVPMSSFTLVSKGWRDLANFAVETPRLVFRLVRLVRGCDARLIYANSSRTFVWSTLAAWLTGRPILWHAHNVLGDDKTRVLVALLARLPNVRAIVCPTENTAAQFGQPSKVRIISQGVDLEHFVPSPALRQSTRSELGIAPSAPVVGIVGDLIPLKGQAVFVAAAKVVEREVPDAVFLVVGKARPTEESRRYAASLQSAVAGSHIRLLGFRSDMAAILNALDVLVIASNTETGPLVLLQALACGTPIVSTPVGQAPVLLSDEACGMLFPIGDSAALVARLLELLNAPAALAAKRQAARQRATQSIGIEESQAQIVGLIEEAIAHHI